MHETLLVIFKILEVVLGVGLIIFVHELGHFLVAKRVGIRVETFSLGFGPRLFGFRRGDTDYRVSLIPLGGYVKMAGENPDDPHTGADDEFSSKSVGQRAAVISAGVVMNVIFAVLGFLIAFKIGVELTRPVVGGVLPGSVAEGVFERGDRILRVGDITPIDFVEVSLAAAFAGDEGLDVEIERDGQRKRVHVSPRKDLGAEMQRIGIEPIDQIARIDPGGAAARAGLEIGDTILTVDGIKPRSLAALLERIYESPGKPLRLGIERGDERLQVTLVPERKPIKSFGFTLAPNPVVRSVVEGAPAEQAGLGVGDVILEIQGESADIATIVDRVKAIAASPERTIRMRVRRADGSIEMVTITPLEPTGGPVIGASFTAGLVAAVQPGSPAERAGIQPGDRILEVAGRAAIGGAKELEQLASVLPEGPVEVVWLDQQGERHEAQIERVEVPGRDYGDGGFEVAPATFTYVAPGFFEPVRLGFERTWLFLEQVFLTIGGMATGRIEPSTLGGPILIGKHAYDVASRGVGTLLYFLCLISVNLAVINILPIPLLDGGHLLFLLIEKIKGEPVSEQVQAALQWLGLALLLMLMIYVTRNDILRLLHG